MHLPSTLLPFLLAVGWLQAQAPLLSDGAEALRREELVWALAPSERPVSPTSPAEDHLRLTEAGAFGIDSSMPTLRVPLSEGLGLGTAQLGSGLMFHGSAKWGRLEAEATLLALRDPQGRALGRLHSGAISFITCPGFNREHEPVVGRSVVVRDGHLRIVEPPDDPWVYHHKWMFVHDGHRGFDVGESKVRSLSWMCLEGVDHSRIGKKSYWEREVVPRIKT